MSRLTFKTIYFKGRAFSTDRGPEEHTARVQGEEVRVWDNVMHGYSSCHVLTTNDRARLCAAKHNETVIL